MPHRDDLGQAVARNLFKLMAIKDEYEVARLFTDGSFARQLGQEFAGWKSLEFHLAPPILGKRDPATGRPVKTSYGPWMMGLFRGLAGLKFLRGTFLDPFGWSVERRMERRLLAGYEAELHDIAAKLSTENYEFAIALAQYPEKIRGFGHVKDAAIAHVMPEAAARRAAFLAGRAAVVAEAAE